MVDSRAGAADAQEKALRQMDRLAVGGDNSGQESVAEDPQITAAERSLLQVNTKLLIG